MHLVTKTYQKDSNLFLYIPLHSAHPPGVTKSIIFSLLQSYWQQNLDIKDYTKMITLLRQRLIARGHQPSSIDPVFRECGLHLRRKMNMLNAATTSSETDTIQTRLFFHIPFHPRDISRIKLQSLYQTHCNTPDERGESFCTGFKNQKGQQMKIDKLTIAYSRPKNLQDLLNPTTLLPPPETSISTICENIHRSSPSS